MNNKTLQLILILAIPFIAVSSASAQTYNIQLKAGWNLISLPLVPDNTDIQAVLSPIISKIKDVWEYDAAYNAVDATQNPWGHYRPGKEAYSDLTQMTAQKGYWINAKYNTTLQIAGSPISTNTIITLKQGWNVISWPYQNSQDIITALSDLTFGTDYNQVSRFNATTKIQENFLNEPGSDNFSAFEPSYGYYIYMLQDRIIILGQNGYFVDSTPPTGTIAINNGAPYTNTRGVTLYLSAQDDPGGSGIAYMCFSNNNVNWTGSISYAPTMLWDISLDCGNGTVYAKFGDAVGNWSSLLSDTIILDQTDPTAVIVTDDGANTANNTQLHATWTQSSDTISGVKEYQYAIGTSSGGTDVVYWTSNGLNREVTHTGLSLTRGPIYYISVRVFDNAGNYSNIASSDGITYGTPPQITDFILSSTNNEYHQGSPITIQAVATDPDGDTIEYRYSVNTTVIQDWTTSSQIVWTPDANYFAENTVKVEVRTQNETGNSCEKQVYIFREPINTA